MNIKDSFYGATVIAGLSVAFSVACQFGPSESPPPDSNLPPCSLPLSGTSATGDFGVRTGAQDSPIPTTFDVLSIQSVMAHGSTCPQPGAINIANDGVEPRDTSRGVVFVVTFSLPIEPQTNTLDLLRAYNGDDNYATETDLSIVTYAAPSISSDGKSITFSFLSLPNRIAFQFDFSSVRALAGVTPNTPVWTGYVLQGDLNEDRTVNQTDLQTYNLYASQDVLFDILNPEIVRLDLNTDGKFDILDKSVVMAHFGENVP